MTDTRPPQATSALLAAIDQDAYEWLGQHAPHYLRAVELELAAGRTPQQIRHIASAQVGPDRQGLALRLEQAARYMAGMQV